MNDTKEMMTKYGFERISQELKKLTGIDIPEVAAEIEHAASLGDLKENAEYHAAKEKQDMLGRRIEEVTALIGNAQIIDPSEYEHDSIKFGSTFTIEDEDTEDEFTYTVVGNVESNLENGLISVSSPLIRQLLGKKEGDFVTVKLPKGEVDYEVLKVYYKG